MSNKIPETYWISHFNHTEHLLKEVYKNSRFECNACGAHGSGMRYRCEPCDLDVHRTCGVCPASLSSFAHPEHELTLYEKPKLFHKCDLCRKFINGIVYRCKDCHFSMHPLCTQIPEYLHSHPLHSPHPLQLRNDLPSEKCDVCDQTCRHWRYFCGVCDVHIHVGCLSSRVGNNNGVEYDDEGGFGEFLEGFVAGAQAVTGVLDLVHSAVELLGDIIG